MSGHNKWANIRLRKGAQDAKRGKAFTKAAKEIIIAAKSGGDPAGNARLRSAIAAAKAVNLPKDKIEAAIRKGTGEDAGGDFVEGFYEGYGPGGIAIMVEVATDNKNRTVAEVRHLFTKHGGSMGENGSVGWMFERKGVISVVSNVAPELVHNCCQAFFDRDTAKACALQLEMLPLEEALFCEVNPIPVKYAMNVLGWNAGECRLPLVEPSDAHKAKIEQALLAAGLIKE